MKHVPMRSCIVCRRQADKSDLLRIVKTQDGGFTVDASGKLAGRGAYVCKNAQCFDGLVKKRALNRTFKAQIPDDEYKKLAEQLKGTEIGERNG